MRKKDRLTLEHKDTEKRKEPNPAFTLIRSTTEDGAIL